MSKVVTNPQPKSRFQESGDNISKHRELLQMKEFERAIDFALLQYQTELCADLTDLNQAASKHLKLLGAHDFVRIFRNLAESRTTELIANITNLDHRV